MKPKFVDIKAQCPKCNEFLVVRVDKKTFKEMRDKFKEHVKVLKNTKDLNIVNTHLEM